MDARLRGHDTKKEGLFQSVIALISGKTESYVDSPDTTAALGGGDSTHHYSSTSLTQPCKTSIIFSACSLLEILNFDFCMYMPLRFW